MKQTIEMKQCPVCGSTTSEKGLTCTDFYVTHEAFELHNCSQCGFRFTQHFPGEDQIGRYYETPDYVSHSNTQRGLMNRLFHAVRGHMLHQKTKMVTQFAKRKRGKLLDVGCGTGFFAHSMQKKGWSVDTIEKSELARQFAQTHFGLSPQLFDSIADIPAETYHVITLWHVLEHLESLNDTLDQLHRVLKKGGVLVVAVPNCVSYDALKYGSFWAAYDVPRHLWHFSPSSMTQLMGHHRFEIKKLKPMPFDAFYISILSERYLKHRFSFIRGMFAGCCAWGHSFFNTQKSSSLIYLIQKTEE